MLWHLVKVTVRWSYLDSNLEHHPDSGNSELHLSADWQQSRGKDSWQVIARNLGQVCDAEHRRRQIIFPTNRINKKMDLE